MHVCGMRMADDPCLFDTGDSNDLDSDFFLYHREARADGHHADYGAVIQEAPQGSILRISFHVRPWTNRLTSGLLPDSTLEHAGNVSIFLSTAE